MTKECKIILENSLTFYGKAFGYVSDVSGEIVFNTSSVGYQEIITDPSYKGQVVLFSFPLIGNYGINFCDAESKKIQPSAIVVGEKCDFPNNTGNEVSLETYLKENGVLGVEGIDTRYLTSIIRREGSMKVFITTNLHKTMDEAKKGWQNLDFKDVIETVSIKKSVTYEPKEKKENQCIAVVDLGCKNGIVKEILWRNFEVAVFPFDVSVKELLSCGCKSVLLSNGPGDPKNAKKTTQVVEKIIGKIPIRGICMGHQILSLIFGGKTSKLKFGHHGSNHPVIDNKTKKIYITSQNHDYYVYDLPKELEITFTNVTDETAEGIKHLKEDVIGVQFHPEGCPGPNDTRFIFEEFFPRK